MKRKDRLLDRAADCYRVITASQHQTRFIFPSWNIGRAASHHLEMAHSCTIAPDLGLMADQSLSESAALLCLHCQKSASQQCLSALLLLGSTSVNFLASNLSTAAARHQRGTGMRSFLEQQTERTVCGCSGG